MNFKNLTPALFAFILSVAPALAQSNPTFKPSATETTVATVASKPSYRQWQNSNFIDKIEYRQNEMVISYRYQNGGSATIWAPHEPLAWLLKDTKGNVYKVKAIKNLKNNGVLIKSQVDAETHISAYDEVSGYSPLNLSCELHFDRLPADVAQVDLIEGAGRETWSNHFNAFEIQIQQPKHELKADETVAQELEMIPHVEEQPIEWAELPEYSELFYEEPAYEEPAGYLEVVYAYDEEGNILKDENGDAIIEDMIWVEEENPEYLGGMSDREIADWENELNAEPELVEWEAPAEELTEAYALSELVKTDKKPKFRQWQPEFSVTRIEYHEKEMVITFQNANKEYLSSTFYGPQGEHAWFLRDKNGNTYPMKALNNLQYNGQQVAAGVLTQKGIYSDWETKSKKEVATCQIVFDRLPADVKIVDLIEGEGRETWSNHFNVFDIKLKTFPTQTTSPEEPAVEPVVVDNNKDNNVSVEVVAVSHNYTLFPNPNKGTFYLTNNGKTQKDATVQVLDLTGRLLFSQTAVVLEEKNSQSFQVANLPAGQYMVRIQHSDNSSESLQMIVVE